MNQTEAKGPESDLTEDHDLISTIFNTENAQRIQVRW